jgi:heme exporter protein A
MSSPGPSAFDFDTLTLTDVARHYGRRRALSGVSLTLHAGELVGLLGPNGAGKSTLLGVLATLVQPSRGSVRYGGRSAADGGAALRASVGFLSHDLQLYAELTARENLEFFAGLHDLDDPRRCAARALERAGLEARGDDLVQGFSRGMRQRLALERALLHEPRLILLDEPFTGLDESSGRALATRLRDLRDQHRIVLLATHDIEVVDGLLDRVLVLRGGRMIELTDGGIRLRERYQQALGVASV